MVVSGGCSPSVTDVSVKSTSICRVTSGRDCSIFAISALGANFSARVPRRLETSEDLAMTSAAVMAAGGAAEAARGDVAAGGSGVAAGPAECTEGGVRKRTAARPIAWKTFAMRSPLLPV